MNPEGLLQQPGEGTLVITLHDALAPAEKELAKTPAGAVVQVFLLGGNAPTETWSGNQ
jgi:hypothetical protein